MNDAYSSDLLLDEYQRAASETSQFEPGAAGLHEYLFGLYGETGQLLSVVKKTHRDRREPYEQEVQEEVGDALWYLSQCAAAVQISLSELGQSVTDRLIRSLDLRLGPAQDGNRLSFKGIDGLLAFVHTKTTPDLNEALNSLAAVVGGLVGDYVGNKPLLAGQSAKRLEEAFYWLAVVAGTVNVSLAESAAANLSKNRSRWPGESVQYLPLFDTGGSEEERLPRLIEMDFLEKQAGERLFVLQRCNGIYIGDRLTDNRVEKDDYRFHDVFHLAYAVHLGWSPVLRTLFKVKRKSDPEIDENQDGARAIILEEAIAAWIFTHAQANNLYANVKVGKLDYSLLKQIHRLVDGYEVYQCPMWQWERAILDGFAAFRSLKNERRGTVVANLDDRTLKYVLRKESST